MYDPKFEKAIQQKMEELEFRPPESVWVNIEKAVVVKRRRRVGLLWRYLLPAVFVVAAAGLYWRHGSTPAGSVGGKAVEPVAGGSAGASLASRPAEVPDAGTENGATGAAAVNAVTGDVATGSVGKAGQRSVTRHNRLRGQVPAGGRSAADGMASETSPADRTTNFDGEAARQSLIVGQSPAVALKGPDAWFYLPGLADQRLAPQIRAAAMGSKKSNTVAMAGLSRPERHWEAGFSAGGGLSRLNRLNSDQARVALAPSTASLYTFSNSSSGSHYISNVQPGASFEGGIYLQRPLSDRWVFNTGMNLHYYSNRISVGQQVTTYVQSSVSYLLATSVQSTSATSIYPAGDTRSVINKYYFLELPVGLQWKINKSRLLPIFVEGGVSLSRLMGASALFYNAKTGLYSKDGDIVNKTQFNIESALLVGLPFHGVNIQLGPQIQYGLTPLVNTQGVGDQHLLYTGIRVVVIPGRK